MLAPDYSRLSHEVIHICLLMLASSFKVFVQNHLDFYFTAVGIVKHVIFSTIVK